MPNYQPQLPTMASATKATRPATPNPFRKGAPVWMSGSGRYLGQILDCSDAEFAGFHWAQLLNKCVIDADQLATKYTLIAPSYTTPFHIGQRVFRAHTGLSPIYAGRIRKVSMSEYGSWIAHTDLDIIVSFSDLTRGQFTIGRRSSRSYIAPPRIAAEGVGEQYCE